MKCPMHYLSASMRTFPQGQQGFAFAAETERPSLHRLAAEQSRPGAVSHRDGPRER